MLYFILILLILVLLVGYKYYYQPKAEIRRYMKIFKDLGYSVYEQSFQIFGMSFLNDYERGKKLYNDAQYYERTVYSQVDIVVGNIVDKVAIIFINPDLIK
jgi:hypothetical protein